MYIARAVLKNTGNPCRHHFTRENDTNHGCFDDLRAWEKEVEKMPRMPSPNGRDTRWRETLVLDNSTTSTAHIAMRKRLRCLNQFREVAVNHVCIDMAEKMCKSSDIVSAKAIRPARRHRHSNHERDA